MIDLQNIFGIGVIMDEIRGELFFAEDVQCEQCSVKMLSQVTALLHNDNISREEVNYRFYMNIMRQSDSNVFKEHGVTNGITIIMPGTIHGECRKNSGHFHQVCEGQRLPYPEAYEILCGEAMFLLQKAENFDAEEELELEDVRVVVLKQGEKLIIPPFYAHCAVNIGDGIMAFGNLAIPCPLNYEAIQKKRGFFTYVMKQNDKLILLPNRAYKKTPDVQIVSATEDATLGMDFHKPLYRSFIEDPLKFSYLDKPEAYVERIEALIGIEKEAER